MGQPVVLGATGPSGSRASQNEDAVAFLEDIRRRCERLLISVLECAWKELED